MVVKEVKQMQEVVTRHRYCDICGVQLVLQCTSHKCTMCGCDICGACSKEDEEDGYSHFCPTCWKIGETYRKILDITRDEYYARVNAITQQWKEEIERVKGKCKK